MQTLELIAFTLAATLWIPLMAAASLYFFFG